VDGLHGSGSNSSSSGSIHITSSSSSSSLSGSGGNSTATGSPLLPGSSTHRIGPTRALAPAGTSASSDTLASTSLTAKASAVTAARPQQLTEKLVARERVSESPANGTLINLGNMEVSGDVAQLLSSGQGHDALSNVALTKLVRQLAIQNKLLHNALTEMKERQKELASNQSLIASTLMSDLSKISATTEMSNQEITFLKQQHMSHRSELQSHLKYLDDHLAKTKEEMLLVAAQVAAIDQNSKAWNEHITKALEYAKQDSMERGIATAKLSERLLTELNDQRVRSDELENTFKATIREITLQNAQANAQAMNQLQGQLHAIIGFVSENAQPSADLNRTLRDGSPSPNLPSNAASSNSLAVLNHSAPPSSLSRTGAQTILSPRAPSQQQLSSHATDQQRIFHQSVRNVTEAYQDTVKGELASMRTQLSAAKLSLEERFADQSRQLRTALQGMRSELDSLKNEFMNLSKSAETLDRNVSDRIHRSEEAVATLSNRYDLELSTVKRDISNLGKNFLEQYAEIRAKLAALQAQTTLGEVTGKTSSATWESPRRQSQETRGISVEVQKELTRLSRDFRDLVAFVRETHSDQNRRLDQLAEQLQSQLVASLSRLRHLDQTRTGVLKPPGRLGRPGSALLSSMVDGGSGPDPSHVSKSQAAAAKAIRASHTASSEKRLVTMTQAGYTGELAQRKWFTTEEQRPTTATTAPVDKSGGQYEQSPDSANYATTTTESTVSIKKGKPIASSSELPRLSLPRLSVASSSSAQTSLSQGGAFGLMVGTPPKLSPRRPVGKQASQEHSEPESGAVDAEGPELAHQTSKGLSMTQNTSEMDDQTGVSGIVSTIDEANPAARRHQASADPQLQQMQKQLHQLQQLDQQHAQQEQMQQQQQQRKTVANRAEAAQAQSSGGHTELRINLELLSPQTDDQDAQNEVISAEVVTDTARPRRLSTRNHERDISPEAEHPNLRPVSPDVPLPPTARDSPTSVQASAPQRDAAPAVLTAAVLKALDQGYYSSSPSFRLARRDASPTQHTHLPPDAVAVEANQAPLARAILARGGKAFAVSGDEATLLDEDGEEAVESLLFKDWISPNPGWLGESRGLMKRRKPMTPAELASLLGLKLNPTTQRGSESGPQPEPDPNEEAPLSPEEAAAISAAAQAQLEAAKQDWLLNRTATLPPPPPGASTHEVLVRKLLSIRQQQEQHGPLGSQVAKQLNRKQNPGGQTGEFDTASMNGKSQRLDLDGRQSKLKPAAGQQPSSKGTRSKAKDKARDRGKERDRPKGRDRARDQEPEGDAHESSSNHEEMLGRGNTQNQAKPTHDGSSSPHREHTGSNRVSGNKDAADEENYPLPNVDFKATLSADLLALPTQGTHVKQGSQQPYISPLFLQPQASGNIRSSTSQGGENPTPPPQSASLSEAVPELPDRRQSLGANFVHRKALEDDEDKRQRPDTRGAPPIKSMNGERALGPQLNPDSNQPSHIFAPDHIEASRPRSADPTGADSTAQLKPHTTATTIAPTSGSNNFKTPVGPVISVAQHLRARINPKANGMLGGGTRLAASGGTLHTSAQHNETEKADAASELPVLEQIPSIDMSTAGMSTASEPVASRLPIASSLTKPLIPTGKVGIKPQPNPSNLAPPYK